MKWLSDLLARYRGKGRHRTMAWELSTAQRNRMIRS